LGIETASIVYVGLVDLRSVAAGWIFSPSGNLCIVSIFFIFAPCLSILGSF
jgi:hypothetical protein